VQYSFEASSISRAVVSRSDFICVSVRSRNEQADRLMI